MSSASASSGAAEHARELQSELRKLDRNMKDVESEAKKLEKHFHSLDPSREWPSSDEATLSYAVDLTVDARMLARAAKSVVVMRNLAEQQIAMIDKILSNVTVLERLAESRAPADAAAAAA